MQVLPNTGIMGEDSLDRMRSDAITASRSKPLHESVVYYLRALEARYLDIRAEQKKSAIRDIAWEMDRSEPSDG